MNSEGVAYCAGILDGEGSIQINPSKGGSGKGYWTLTVQISNNCESMLRWMREEFDGIGSITSWKSKKSTQGKISYNWRTYGPQAGKLLSTVGPFLRIKQEHAKVALEFLRFKTATGLPVSQEAKEHRMRLAIEIRELNRLYGKAVPTVPFGDVI